MPHTAEHTMSREMQQCIKDCLECASSCWSTARHCLEMGGQHAEAQHITLLLDCAEVCQTDANLMLRGSRFSGRACAVCAEMCRACEEDCRRLADGDQTMKECADVCHRCAESCNRMARVAS